MTLAIGLDLGSRRTKAVVTRAGDILDRALFGPLALDGEALAEWIRERLDRQGPLPIATTGYGRKAGATRFHGRALTEIRAFALGAAALAPQARTIVDIGGQDAKAIRLEAPGRVGDFEMNDRCAAGTGKFFELVAQTLGLGYPEFVAAALAAPEAAEVSATCAVFAESEIIGRLAEGVAPACLARGVFRAVALRLAAMLERTGGEPPLALVGGGANACLAAELEALRGYPVLVPGDGVFFGAVGAALFAASDREGGTE